MASSNFGFEARIDGEINHDVIGFEQIPSGMSFTGSVATVPVKPDFKLKLANGVEKIFINGMVEITACL